MSCKDQAGRNFRLKADNHCAQVRIYRPAAKHRIARCAAIRWRPVSGEEFMSHSFKRSVLAAALSAAIFGAPSVFAVEAVDDAEAGAAEDAPWQGEAVNVTAKGTAADVPSALATDVVTWQEAVGEPLDFQDLISRVPGIGATGQN